MEIDDPDLVAPRSSSFKYDVAISFLDEDEPLAAQIAEELKRSGLSVFTYSQRQAEVVGTDGATTFSNVFGRDARTVVVLARQRWGQTKWTRIEETAIKDRLFNDGPEFLTFVQLEQGAAIPSWLPRTRIWLDFNRFRVGGAVALIEERVRRAGGVIREETIAENAARLRDEERRAAERIGFLHSQNGVRAANEEAVKLIEQVEAMKEAGEYEVTRQQLGVQLYRAGYSVFLVWHNAYINTLNESALWFTEWKGRPNFGGRRFSRMEEPTQLAEHQLAFDITDDGVRGWRDESGRFRTTERVAEDAVRRLLELVRQARNTR
jgi:hypothetical protein